MLLAECVHGGDPEPDGARKSACADRGETSGWTARTTLLNRTLWMGCRMVIEYTPHAAQIEIHRPDADAGGVRGCRGTVPGVVPDRGPPGHLPRPGRGAYCQ